MPFSLAGHTAVITGSSTGLGRAMAETLGRAGAKVVVNYGHHGDQAQQAFREIQQAGIEAILVQADVTDEAEVDRLFRATEDQLGPADIVVVNATPYQYEYPIEQYDWEFHQQMVDFFIKSPFLLTRRALPSMKAHRWGRVVNITSEVFHRGVGRFSAYVAAKGGQIGWSRSMSRELAPFGITVNTVAPGWIPTKRHLQADQHDKDAYLAGIPAGRWGVPQDVANAALYFASAEASFVTGQTLCVNGGLTPW